MGLNCCIIGTDTNVGKTHILGLLCHGLRQLGRQVWVHKPVACGDWQDGQADDGRALQALADSKQNPKLVCPLQFPAAASPHLAALDVGMQTTWQQMASTIHSLKGDHDLLVESAGGILAPLSTDDGTIIDVCLAESLPCVLVTRPDLGTLNHTLLSVHEARRRGLCLLGIIINYHRAHIDRESLAIRTVKAELERLCAVPVIYELDFAKTAAIEHSKPLAEQLLSLHVGVR